MKKVLFVLMAIMVFMFSSVALAKDVTPAQKHAFGEVYHGLGYGVGFCGGLVEGFSDIYNEGGELKFDKTKISKGIDDTILKIDAVIPEIKKLPIEMQASANKSINSGKMKLLQLKNACINLKTSKLTFSDYVLLNQTANSVADDVSGFVRAAEIYLNDGEEASVKNSAYQNIKLGEYYTFVMGEFGCHPSTLISSNMKENEIVEVYSWKGMNNTKIIITFRNYRVVAKKIQ